MFKKISYLMLGYIVFCMLLVSFSEGASNEETKASVFFQNHLLPPVSRGMSLETKYLEVPYFKDSKSKVKIIFISGNKQELGYAISKENKLYEISPDTPPVFSNQQEYLEIVRRAVGSNREIGKPSFFYIGSDAILIQFPVYAEGKQLFSITIDARSRQIVDGNIPPFLRRIKTDDTKGSFLHEKEKILEGVPRYRFYLLDEATCLSMIIAYWSKNGFAELKNENETPEELTGAMAKGCGSCSERTTIEIFGASRNVRIKTHFYSLPSQKDGSPATFELVKNEIENGRPLLLKLQSGSISRHSVIVGYLETEEGRFVVVEKPLYAGKDSHGGISFLRWPPDVEKVEIFTITPEKSKTD